MSETPKTPTTTELLERIERLERAMVAVHDRNGELAGIEHVQALDAVVAPALRARDARRDEERARARARKLAAEEAAAAERQAELARIRLEGDRLPEELERLLGKVEVLRALDRLVAPLARPLVKGEVLIVARARAEADNGSKRAGPGAFLASRIAQAVHGRMMSTESIAPERVATIRTGAGVSGEWSIEWTLAVVGAERAAQLAADALSTGSNKDEIGQLAARLTSPNVPTGHLRVLFASSESLDLVARPVVEVVHVRRPSAEAKAA